MKVNIKDRICNAVAAFWSAIKSHPVELIILLHATVAVCWTVCSTSHDTPWFVTLALGAPLAWGLAFTLQALRERGLGWKIAYWGVLGLYALSLLFIKVNLTYFIAVFAVLPLWLLVRRKLTDNLDFTAGNGQSVWNLAVSLFFGGVAYVLICLIFYSILIIFFSLDGPEYEVLSHFVGCAAAIVFILVVPMMFTALEDRGGRLELKGFWVPLLNWVVSPALLIYTVVLYIYAGKVLFTWTLPEGSVALMVFAFCIVCMLAKMLQQLVDKQPFRWFYRSFSWIALPLVALFWVGTFRRIGEYGLTESRYYLLLSGALMTFYVLLFAFRNRRGYFILTTTALVLVMLSICLPPLSAKQVSFRSQLERVRTTAAQIGLLNDDGTLIVDHHLEGDTLHLAECREIYKSLEYLEENDSAMMRQQLGFAKSVDFLGILSQKAAQVAQRHRWNPAEEEDMADVVEMRSLDFYYDSMDIDLRRYSHARTLRGQYYSVKKGMIQIDGVQFNADTLLARQLRKVGVSADSMPPKDWFTDERRAKMCFYEDEQYGVLFSNISIEQDGSDCWAIDQVWVELLLTK